MTSSLCCEDLNTVCRFNFTSHTKQEATNTDKIKTGIDRIYDAFFSESFILLTGEFSQLTWFLYHLIIGI